MEKDDYIPLFETQEAKGRMAYRLSMFLCICLVFWYIVSYLPGEGEEGRWAWIGLVGAELWFSLYWVFTQSVRWNRIYQRTAGDVDIFVCTADPTVEPPVMVMNTVLSLMAYDYPPEKLSVYLSDDEASHFSKLWLPFCKKFRVEPRSPAAYFSTNSEPLDPHPIRAKEWSSVKHKGFPEWGLGSNDHHTFLQILIDGRDSNSVDMEGSPLPTMVYMAREKRPQHHHNFKDGAMNALLRVSSKISEGQIILNVDCDMYSNDSQSMRDALCFFMDEKKGNEIAYVQYPQSFNNITKNYIYGSSIRQIYEVDRIFVNFFISWFGWLWGPLYIGTGCFHRRDALCGKKYNGNNPTKTLMEEKKAENDRKVEESISELEERLKMGLKYGCPVEDVITGLSIQCRGWKSVYFSPARKGFLGVAPTTLPQSLVQHKRWSEGDFQILLSKYSPLLFGHGKIKAGLQMGYYIYCLWAPNCLATLYYVAIPSLYLFKGISLFPQISNAWSIPFAYLIIAMYTYSLGEFLCFGGTFQGWWNDQRMWMFKRTISYLFAFTDTLSKVVGVTKSAFVITSKVSDQDVAQRYEQEIMEFGSSSPMFSIIATLALLNLFSLFGGIKRVVMQMEADVFQQLGMQIFLCGFIVVINQPVYQALFLRKDKGGMPRALTFISVISALLACVISLL
uniref:Cellulose synthase-like protein E1 n=1 Tax=Nelumbo nucifera TaxID=4432 RepID=A0A822XTP1_NELNU|nr:TPA_asm: hypothetical protein HUJ06_025150 [Nelumbo nucifera]